MPFPSFRLAVGAAAAVVVAASVAVYLVNSSAEAGPAPSTKAANADAASNSTRKHPIAFFMHSLRSDFIITRKINIDSEAQIIILNPAGVAARIRDAHVGSLANVKHRKCQNLQVFCYDQTCAPFVTWLLRPVPLKSMSIDSPDGEFGTRRAYI